MSLLHQSLNFFCLSWHWLFFFFWHWHFWRAWNGCFADAPRGSVWGSLFQAGSRVRGLWYCCGNIQLWNLDSEECGDRADSLRDSGLSSGMNNEMKLTKHTGHWEKDRSTPRHNDMASRKSKGAEGNDRLGKMMPLVLEKIWREVHIVWDFPSGTVDENSPTNAGDTVWSLVREDSTWCGATKSMCRNYWACALRPRSCNYWTCTPRTCASQQGKPLQWDAQVLQQRVAPARRN